MPTVDILGVPHAYDLVTPASPETIGELATETIVFVHGWLLSRRYWQPLVSRLRAYQCLTYDMRGFGESTKASSPQPNQPSAQSAQSAQLAQLKVGQLAAPRTIPLPANQNWYPSEAPYTNDRFSLAAYAQDLAALLDALKLDSVWLMGHSLGGSVALWAAYLFPQRVKGVICLNAGGGIYIQKEFEKFRGAGQQMVKYRPQWLMKLPGLPRVFTRAMVYQTLGIEWGRQRVRDFICADRDAAEGSLLASTTPEEVLQLPQLMGALAQPVHFITATQDSIMPPCYVNHLASFHRDFRVHSPQGMVSEIANCGHMAMLEQPEAVAAAVRAVVAGASFTHEGC